MCTAHFLLCTELHFSLRVFLFFLPVKATPSFLPLICLCRHWDMKRHFWHLFPICAPTQKPPEQVLLRFHLLSACLSPRSPAVQGKPLSYLSKETDQKNKKVRFERKRQRRKSSLRSRYLCTEVRKTSGWNIYLDVLLMDSLLFCFTAIFQLSSVDYRFDSIHRLFKCPADRLLWKCMYYTWATTCNLQSVAIS